MLSQTYIASVYTRLMNSIRDEERVNVLERAGDKEALQKCVKEQLEKYAVALFMKWPNCCDEKVRERIVLYGESLI